MLTEYQQKKLLQNEKQLGKGQIGKLVLEPVIDTKKTCCGFLNTKNVRDFKNTLNFDLMNGDNLIEPGNVQYAKKIFIVYCPTSGRRIDWKPEIEEFMKEN